MARAESGDRVLEERATSPLLTSRVSGERCKLPQRGPRRAPATKRFSRILSVQSGVSRQFSAVYTVPRFTRATSAKTRAMNRLPQWTPRHCYTDLCLCCNAPTCTVYFRSHRHGGYTAHQLHLLAGRSRYIPPRWSDSCCLYVNGFRMSGIHTVRRHHQSFTRSTESYCRSRQGRVSRVQETVRTGPQKI